MAVNGADLDTPRVEGVQLTAYLGRGLDLNRVGTRVGGYSSGSIGASFSHDVYDVHLSAFHPFVQARIPPTIASSQDGSILRLYVPVRQRGQITDIGVLNGAYRSPGYPFVPRAGGKIYTAPADDAKYRARAPSREQAPWPREGDQNWRPGPGDRFHLIEVS